LVLVLAQLEVRMRVLARGQLREYWMLKGYLKVGFL
jgi:hypothetical protein